MDVANLQIIKYWLICISVIACEGVFPSGLAHAFEGSAQSDAASHKMKNCVPGASVELRQRCDEAVLDQLRASSQTTVLDGGWRLVKTRNPENSSETVSAIHTVDTAKSDIDLAGLSLNCSSGGIQIALVLLSRFPRDSYPRVTLTAGSNRSEFEGLVTQSGEGLLLPPAATNLAARDWQNVPELSIEIETKSDPIRGILPLRGLSSALRTLTRNCR